MNIEEKHEEKEEERPIIVRNSTDLQRLKLEKLMKNPDKPVIIPERPKERGMPNVPDFVRNVMGSSAGAGSGEFHVYRHLRRKEYARQKYMKERADKEKLEDEYKIKLEENKKLADERTAKKRLKRLKRKKARKNSAKKPKLADSKQLSSSSEQSDNSENEIVKESIADCSEAHKTVHELGSKTMEHQDVCDSHVEKVDITSNNECSSEENSAENTKSGISNNENEGNEENCLESSVP